MQIHRSLYWFNDSFSFFDCGLPTLEAQMFNVIFSNISAISWRPVLVVEEAGITGREPPTMGKQLVNFITCGCESSAPFL